MTLKIIIRKKKKTLGGNKMIGFVWDRLNWIE